jgi:transposase-like protein
VGRVLAVLTGETVSAQTVSQLMRVLDPAMVRQLERDLPELLHFFAFPRHLWKKLHTTNVMERCFVEVRRRTRPMVVFTNVESVDRIIYAIFSRFNEDWKNHTLNVLHKQLDVTCCARV